MREICFIFSLIWLFASGLTTVLLVVMSGASMTTIIAAMFLLPGLALLYKSFELPPTFVRYVDAPQTTNVTTNNYYFGDSPTRQSKMSPPIQMEVFPPSGLTEVESIDLKLAEIDRQLAALPATKQATKIKGEIVAPRQAIRQLTKGETDR